MEEKKIAELLLLCLFSSNPLCRRVEQRSERGHGTMLGSLCLSQGAKGWNGCQSKDAIWSFLWQLPMLHKGSFCFVLFCSFCTFHVLSKVLLTFSFWLTTSQSPGRYFRKTKIAKGAFDTILLFYLQMDFFSPHLQLWSLRLSVFSSLPTTDFRKLGIFICPWVEETCFKLQKEKKIKKFSEECQMANE